jgi:uncharacterized protein (TIGR04255 family)
VRASLPEPFEGTLPGSPLALVACQVRFADPAERITTTRVGDLLEALRSKEHGYTRADPVRVQTVTIDASNLTPATGELATAWRLTSEDGRWVATLSPDSYTLETTNYRTWHGDFRARIDALVRTMEASIHPSIITRVGLRYVDSLRLGREPDSYRTLISAALLGPLVHPLFGSGVIATQQQFSFALDESLRVTIRHGLFPGQTREEAPTYLLDTDIYREDLMRLDSAALLQLIDGMHNDHLRVFRACLTDTGLASLRETAS